MLPWDYNLAFGTFQGGNAQSAVNTPIDAPVSGGTVEDRPMWHWILSNESYTELYHQYFSDFLNTVDIQTIISNAYTLIKPYVEKDPTAFYSPEEFETAVETLRQFCALRSESVSMQLESGETTTDMSYVDASGLTLSNMGSMGMGGRFGGDRPEGFGGVPDRSSDETTTEPSDQAAESRPSRGNMPMPGGDFNPNAAGMNSAASGNANRIWLAVSVLVLGIGLLIAKLYKKY